ncbi:MAG: hypothetical protein IPO62_04570 [Saprospiraceae bacterium]|nr:hypothetical protein [Saprospiraceae bacterium]
MKKLFISSIAIILLVASCKSIKNVNKKNTNELSLSDYVMCSAPNEIDIVGFVFAVNKKQEKVPITYLNIQKINGDAQLRNITYKRTIDWKILAGFLGTPNINLTANTAFKDSVTVTTNMSFEGSRIDRGLLLDTQNELTEKKSKNH